MSAGPCPEMFTCIALIGNLRANKQMIGDAHEVQIFLRARESA
jgi:hypothetical protein